MYSRQRLLEGILDNEETLAVLEEGIKRGATVLATRYKRLLRSPSSDMRGPIVSLAKQNASKLKKMRGVRVKPSVKQYSKDPGAWLDSKISRSEFRNKLSKDSDYVKDYRYGLNKMKEMRRKRGKGGVPVDMSEIT